MIEFGAYGDFREEEALPTDTYKTYFIERTLPFVVSSARLMRNVLCINVCCGFLSHECRNYTSNSPVPKSMENSFVFGGLLKSSPGEIRSLYQEKIERELKGIH